MRKDYTIRVISYSADSSGYNTVFLVVNSLQDAPEVDEKWETGSIMWDINGKALYMLDKQGNWIAQ